MGVLWQGFAGYLALYLLAWKAEFPVPGLVFVFQLANVAFSVFVASKLVSAWKRSDRSDRLAAMGLFLLLWIPGAYLEFPSDPWEHLRRIRIWGGCGLITDHDFHTRFPYFFGWSWLGTVPPRYLRATVDLYSAVWQWALGYQVYRLARALGFEKSWSRVQVLGFFALFGTDLFSFRYYALAPAMLAQISFLALIEHGVMAMEGRAWKLIWPAPFLMLLMAFSHPQTILFLLPVVTAFGLYWAHRAVETAKPAFFWALVLAEVILFVGLSAFCWHDIYGSKTLLGEWVKLACEHRTWWGSFRFDAPYLRLASTLGIHGYVAVAAALFLLRSRPLLALLMLMPTFFLVWPGGVVVLSRIVPEPGALYRFLYAFPLSFSLVEVVRRGTATLSGKHAPWIGAAIITAIGLPVSEPWYGRLRFQLYRPDPLLTFRALDETAHWLSADPIFDRIRRRGKIVLLTDVITATVLEAELGVWLGGGTRVSFPEKIGETWWLTKIGVEKQITAVLLADLDKVPLPPRSWVAKHTHHWDEARANLHNAVDKDPRIGPELTKRGWTARQIPPFYTLYEKP